MFDPKNGPNCERVRNMYVCVNFGRASGRGYENTSLMAVSPHSLLIRVGAIGVILTNRRLVFVVV